MPAPSEMGGAGTTGHAPIPEEEEDDEEVDEAGVEAKVTVLYLMLLVIEKTTHSTFRLGSEKITFLLEGLLFICRLVLRSQTF